MPAGLLGLHFMFEINQRLHILHDLGDGTLEVLAGHIRDERVHLLAGLLILVPLAGEAHADAVGDVPDTLRPHELVELDVEADIGGAHGLASEGLDLLHGTGSALLELTVNRKRNTPDQKMLPSGSGIIEAI